ncbi:MAG: hypothetical protein M1830_001559 [Pleopsidium flavum]|nr:MAG: hypothetical protein M1830_001559 [Pleopsidium flavum]
MALSHVNGNMLDYAVNGENGEQVVALPLNLIALIVSYLDDVADLARVCRTCRVLHYMTLPQLYTRVTLHSYARIRYGSDERPEGCGGASPLAMGLNGLISRNITGLVRSFSLSGEWKEYDLEEFAKVGRVSDNSMMLSMVVRAAVEKMEKLESFSWELNTKMLQTVYHGLAQRPTLSSLTIKFPALRLPRPVILIPPIPKLKTLKITDIDPLCYPDDISLLLLGSKNLRDLKLHWSPRMRDGLEPSVTLHSYFGRCIAADYKLPVKFIAFQNLYAQQIEDFEKIFDPKKIQGITMINSLAGAGDSIETTFVDDTWRMKPPKFLQNLKMMRGDNWSRTHCDLLSKTTGLQKLYLISAKKERKEQLNGTVDGIRSLRASSHPPVTPATPSGLSATSLGKDYLAALSENHGTTLRHLLLPSQWRLGSDDIAKLVRSCPHLEQLGLCIEKPDLNLFRHLLPFLPKLFAIRILENPNSSAFSDDLHAHSDETHERKISRDISKRENSSLKWLGICDLLFEVGRMVSLGEIAENGEPLFTRTVKRVSLDAVKDIEIWGLDSLQI